MKHERRTQASFVFNVLLACSRLREGGERRREKKKPRPDETEEVSQRRTAPSLFSARFLNFAIPRMISNSEPNVLLGLEP